LGLRPIGYVADGPAEVSSQVVGVDAAVVGLDGVDRRGAGDVASDVP
jgi:hypothetical protein